MKLRICTALVSLWTSISALACGYLEYSPRFYFTFRVDEDTAKVNRVWQNCRAWQAVTSKDISLEDIRQVVYKWNRYDFDSWTFDFDKSYWWSDNSFARWIAETSNREVLSFLQLAKECEETRAGVISRWYYAVDGDDYQTTLERIARKAVAYQGTLLKDRYTLQAVRALFSLRRYDECLKLWEERSDSLPEGVIKDMIKEYAAGSYFRIGEQKKSDRLFAELGFPPKHKEDGTRMSRLEQIEWMYEAVPESSYFAAALQEHIHDWEWDENFCSEKRLNPQDSTFHWKDCKPLYELCTRAAEDKRVTQRAVFCYTAAYLADKFGRMEEARRWVARAEQMPCSQYMKESISVLRMYIDAKTLPYTAAYEQRLHRQLQAMVERMKRDKVDKTLFITFYQKNGYSVHYWSDMMRKVLIGEVAPRYLKQGNAIRAIQVVNMADNVLVNHTGVMQEERTIARLKNEYDYSNHLDALMDSIGGGQLAAYVQRVEHPQSAFDRFLNEHSYTDLNYLYDRVGTQYLYEGRYAQAARYLEKVEASFQQHLNTARYLRRNPFSEKPISECFLPDHYRGNGDAKLNFARQMQQLEVEMKHTADPNRKAQQMLRYAIGMYNSHNRCWALTRYEDPYYKEDWLEAKLQEVEQSYDRMVGEALATFTDDECKAVALWQLGHFVKVIKDYPRTGMAAYLRERCDNWEDYVGL